MILRRDMPEVRGGWRKRMAELRGALVAGGVILIGIGAIAAWLAGSARVGRYFAGGLAGSLLALGVVAWFLLRALRGFLRGRSPWRVPSLVLHA